MAVLARARTLLKLWFYRAEVEAELDAEVQAFYDTVVDRLVKQGVPRHEAIRLANLKFNTPESAKEEIREAQTGAAIAAFFQEVKFALRLIRRAPTFAVVTILTLGLGIGANSTIFSIVSRFVLGAPPVGDPNRLMALHTAHRGDCCNSFSWPLFSDLRGQVRSFSGVAAYYELVPASVGGRGEPERVWGQAATANFFDVSRLGMSLGRGFTRTEEQAPVIVLGYGLWRHRFAGDPSIIGKVIALSGQPFTVVGVAPPGFRGVDIILESQFWVPLGLLDRLLPGTSNYESRDYHWVAVIARLQPAVTRQQAAAELGLLAERFARAHPETEKDGGFPFETAGSLSPSRDKPVITMFLVALTLVALLVLLIACANVANMFLAHASGRQREMAIRLALGATRVRLVRQMLTESVLLALGGGLFGVALSFWATHALIAFRLPAPVPLDLTVHQDWRALLYAFILSVGAGVLFGSAPAWTIVRPVISNGLKGEDPVARPGRAWTLRNILVVAQIAMSLVLLCTMGLFLRSLQNASQTEIGLRSRGLFMMAVDPRLHGYTAERTTDFLNRLRQRLATLPGVVSATYTDSVPLSGGHRSDPFHVEAGTQSSRGETNVELYMVGPDYFETIGTPRVAGRDLSDAKAGGPRVAIVNQAFSQRFFRNANPIGQLVTGGGRTYRIIGITGNIKSRTLGEEIKPVLYRSLAQDIAADPSTSGYSVIVRCARGVNGITTAMRREVHLLDPNLAVFNEQTMEEHVHDALFLPRVTSTLFGVFGMLGLLLAAVGLYGVMSYWVTRRTREIGIRLALGARADEMQRMIIRQGMTLTLFALIPGLVAAWAVSKLFSSALYGVTPHDLATFALAPLFLALIALLACWIPSRSAAGTQPLVALRHE